MIDNKESKKMFGKNKGIFKYIFCLEFFIMAFMLLFTFYEYSHIEKIDANLDDWLSRRIEYQDNFWYVDESIVKVNRIVDIIYGPYIELPADSYTASIQYECDVDQACLPFANNDNNDYLQAETVLLSSDDNDVKFRFDLTHKIDNFELVFKYNGQGSFAIKGIDISTIPSISWQTCILWLILFVILDSLYFICQFIVRIPAVKDSNILRILQIKLTQLWHDERLLSQRFVLVALCAFTFVFTFIVFGPCEIYISNIQYLSFSFTSLVTAMLFVGLLVFALLFIVIILLHGKIFNYVLSLLFALTIAGYLQGFFNINHGSLNGESVDWLEYKVPMLENFVFWCLIIVLVFSILYFSNKLWDMLIKIICSIIIVAQSVALGTLIFTANFPPSQDMYISTSNIYEISDKQNVIVFLLDRCDRYFIDDLMDMNPDWRMKLGGFTEYQDFTGSYSRTFPSIAYLLTGIHNDYTIPSADYLRNAWASSTFLSDIKSAGYETRIYADTTCVFGVAANVENLVENIGTGGLEINYNIMVDKMLTLSAYRYSPEVFKPYFQIYTGDLENIAVASNGEFGRYMIDDPAFWAAYQEQGLTIDNESQGAFVFYHLFGAHPPYKMNEKAEQVSSSRNESARDAQLIGSMNMIFQYIDELKEKGVYDETTIIITTDHGVDVTQPNMTELDDVRMLLLMIKPAGADVSLPLQISNKQVCQDNLRASIIGYFGLDTTTYGRTIESVGEDEQMTRYVRMQGYGEDITTGIDTNNLTYEVKGNGNDFANWKIISIEPILYPFS